MPDLEHIKGAAALSRMLKELPDKLAKRTLRQAIAKGATAVRDEARSRAPVRTGKLKRNIIIKYIAEKSNNEAVTYYVLARSGARFARMRIKRKGVVQIVDNDTFYWRFLEFGTAHMAPRPFMRPAFEAKKDAALGLIVDKLRAGLDQSVRELNAQYNVGA